MKLKHTAGTLAELEAQRDSIKQEMKLQKQALKSVQLTIRSFTKMLSALPQEPRTRRKKVASEAA